MAYHFSRSAFSTSDISKYDDVLQYLSSLWDITENAAVLGRDKRKQNENLITEAWKNFQTGPSDYATGLSLV